MTERALTTDLVRTETGTPGDFDSKGVKIHYVVAGDPAGEPVVLIHGFLADIRSQWVDSEVCKSLADQKYRVIMLDNRGHGQSDKPDRSASDYGAKMAEDVAGLMGQLKVTRAHVVGYSMGAWIAQKLAADHPAMVQSLTVGGAGWLKKPGDSPLMFFAPALAQVAAGSPLPTTVFSKLLPKDAPPVNQRNATALKLAAEGSSGLALTESEAKVYSGKKFGLRGEDDTWLLSQFNDLQAIHAEMKWTVVPGTHLTAFTTPEFRSSLLAFLKTNPMLGTTR